MKASKLLIMVPLMALFIQTSTAKSQTIGLYLTREDYLNHKLSYNSNGDKVKVTGLFETSNVVLAHDGKKQALPKSEIFGYSKDGQDYRFFNNVEYRILESKGLIIYSHSKLVQQGKGPKPTELHYFSSSLSDPIQPLTIANLQNTYSKYPKFIYAVEALFNGNEGLAAYDTYNKQYKVAYLYEQNVK